jgi:hypothetical protein
MNELLVYLQDHLRDLNVKLKFLALYTLHTTIDLTFATLVREVATEMVRVKPSN